MNIKFTAHNIRRDNGSLTKPDEWYSMENHPWFVSAQRILNVIFLGERSHLRLIDLGCLEGGFSVEFARMGFQVIGLEVREASIAACNYVKANTNLPNLEFVKDNAWNIEKYGKFDVVFCCGLLYHFDKPKQFLNILSAVTKKLLILQTHFSMDDETADSSNKFNLSELSDNEGLIGRWYVEFASDEALKDRDRAQWSSWDNRQSFWIQREYLLQTIHDVGFDLVMEQYDSLGPNIAESMLRGYYKVDGRETFIGIKTNPVKENYTIG